MASAVAKKQCAKCSKDAGVTTCSGCQQSLCTKHFIEHRQELSQKMENVGQEHDLLQRDLNQQNAEHSLFLEINTWEQETIASIRWTAEAARADLQELLDRNSEELKKSVTKITNELQSCREADNYTEIDINKWTHQLQALRKTLESPSTISVEEDLAPETIIRIIQVRDEQQYHSPDFAAEPLQYFRSADENWTSSSSNERFDMVVGNGIVSEGGFVVTCTGNSISSSPSIYGRNQYWSGTHPIHFQIEKTGDYSMFFGISGFSRQLKQPDGRDPSLCGWWDLDKIVLNGWSEEESLCNNMITAGDRITLILDCDNRQIQLQHHRTNRLVQMAIDLNNCASPSKVVVMLKGDGDSIRILQ